MRGISIKHVGILTLLKDNPDGLMLTQIAFMLHTSKENISDAIGRLLKKGLIEKQDKGTFKLILITNSGRAALKPLTESSVGSPVGAHAPTTPLPPSPAPKPGIAPQRAHAFQAYAHIYRTSYDRAEEVLDLHKISFTKAMKPAQYTLTWKGIKLKITKRRLIAYPHEINAPIEIEGAHLRHNALNEAMSIMADFLSLTNLRCKTGVDGHLIAFLPKWEIAFTNNETAAQLTRKGGRIAIAFNRDTGSASIWADKSFSRELETNADRPHQELRMWGQGIQDGVISPYRDEIRHRQREAQFDDKLLQVATKLDEYGTKLNKHLPILELAEKLLKADPRTSRKVRRALPEVRGQAPLGGWL